MIIRVSEEDVPTLLKASGRNGLFVRQTQRHHQEKQVVKVSAGENYVIWMLEDKMLSDAQQKSANSQTSWDLPGASSGTNE